MNFGKIIGEPFEIYHASDAVGSGRLKDLRPRAKVYQQKHITREIPAAEDTAAFLFGQLFHCLALEGEAVVARRYVTVPEDAPKRPQRRHVEAKKPSAATLDAAQWWDEFDAAHMGMDVVAQADIDLAWKMVRAIRAKPAALELLTRGEPEVTFRHHLPAFAVQSRVDWFRAEDPAGPMCVNVKTIDSLDDFDHQFEKFGYYKSDAFYRLVVARVLGIETSVPQMVNLVVEKNAPYECSIRIPDAESLELGTREVMSDLTLLTRCYESGVWPGEPDEARPVSLPTWKIKNAQ